MNRRSFFAALASVPFVARAVKAFSGNASIPQAVEALPMIPAGTTLYHPTGKMKIGMRVWRACDVTSAYVTRVDMLIGFYPPLNVPSARTPSC